MASQEYFLIDRMVLKNGKIFPFTLFVFNPQIKKFSLFLEGNSPFTSDKNDLLKFVLERGGSLAICIRQKRTFLNHVELKEEDIPSLQKNNNTTEINTEVTETKQNISTNDTDNEEKKETFTLSSELEKCIITSNYLPLIDKAREEIILFPQTVSHTVSLAAYLASKLLISDNLTNRICAVSYFLAKNSNIKSYAALGDLICAALLHHLGHTQLDHRFVISNQLELGEEDRKSYQKHPGLTQHLLKKCGINLSDRTMRIILEHHERNDGRGYPNSKKGLHIEPLALLLGAVSHIFEYSSGRITGQASSIQSVLQNLKNKNFVPGLEFEFGATIYESLSYLIKTEKTLKAS